MVATSSTASTNANMVVSCGSNVEHGGSCKEEGEV